MAAGCAPEYREQGATVLSDPDRVIRLCDLASALLFSRGFGDVLNGKHIVVVVVLDSPPSGRAWIITAYIARRLSGGVIAWTRS